MTTRCFSRVQVAIPNGTAREAQEVNFVNWLGGRLVIDAHNELALSPEGVAKEQNLGSLKRASAVAHDDTKGRAMDIKTDNVAGIFRITFEKVADAREFASVADAIEREEAAEWEQSRRERAERHEALMLAVRAALSSKKPIVYKGVELFGIDPGAEEPAEEAAEVLVGSGVLVLLDTPGTGNVGTYELAFYGDEDDACKPSMTIPIAPKTRIKRRERERAVLDDEEEAAITFDISGACPHAVAFDDVALAEEFYRDFEVRQRVMELAARCSEQERTLSLVRLELDGFKNPGSIAGLWSSTQYFAALVVVPLAIFAYYLGKWL